MKSRVETNTKLVISVLIISCLVIPPNRDLMYVTWPVDNETVHHYIQQISKSLGLDGYGELSTQPEWVSAMFWWVLNLSEFLLCFGEKVLSGVWLSARQLFKKTPTVSHQDIFRFSESRTVSQIPKIPFQFLSLKCFLSCYGQAVLI